MITDIVDIIVTVFCWVLGCYFIYKGLWELYGDPGNDEDK